MTALGQASPTTAANFDQRRRMLDAYAKGRDERSGRPYPSY
jgi:hypothetical protein